MQILHLHLSRIHVEADRQRKDLGNLDELMASIKDQGQLQPIVVTEEVPFKPEDPGYKLVAGERRFRSHERLGMDSIYAVLKSELPLVEQELIELNENVQRKQLDWPEYIGAVNKYAEAAANATLTQIQIANKLGIPEATLSRMLRLAPALIKQPHLSAASSWTSAYQSLVDKEKKEADSMLEDLLGGTDDDIPLGLPAAKPLIPGTGMPVAPSVVTSSAPASEPKPEWPAIAHNINFLDWIEGYEGRRFNLLHCDFPYGLNMQSANLQSSSVRWEEEDGRYEDSSQLFYDLTKAFIKHQNKILAENAHMIFWTSHKYLPWVQKLIGLSNNVCEVSLIWHKSGGEGIAPDVRRQPRRTYEIALFATKGDRRIAKVKAASISAAITKVHHLSEKPMEVVTHFLEMLVDETTEILDPTCGAGSALEAAINLGCKRAVGFDVIQKHVDVTNSRCHAALERRRIRAAGGVPHGDTVDSIVADII